MLTAVRITDVLALMRELIEDSELRLETSYTALDEAQKVIRSAKESISNSKEQGKIDQDLFHCETYTRTHRRAAPVLSRHLRPSRARLAGYEAQF